MITPAPGRLPGLSPHHVLLLRAALCDGEAAIAAWRAWQSQMTLTRADSGSTRIFPMVYRNLRAQGMAEDGLPPLLKGTCRFTWARAQPLLDEGLRAAQLLQGKGVDVLFIKGAAMMLAGYPHPDVRAINDVDILVPCGAARDAIAALRAAGWQPRVPDVEQLVAIRHAAEFTGPEGRRLDLHWHALLERCDEDADTIFRIGARATLHSGARVRVASPEALLLMACVYGPCTPARPPLRWLADVATIAKAGVDWDQVIAATRRLQLAPAVRSALEFISAQIGVRLPGGVLERVQAIPVSSSDKLEHVFTSRGSPLLGCVPALWFNYRRTRATAPRVGFPQYVQYHFGLPQLGQLPGFIAKAGARRLARQSH